MEKNNLPPSLFCTFPWSSVIGKVEAEIVAFNIMNILARTGDNWRVLSWEEYTLEREKDGNFSSSEKIHFDAVKEFTWQAREARFFCLGWRIIYRDNTIKSN